MMKRNFLLTVILSASMFSFTHAKEVNKAPVVNNFGFQILGTSLDQKQNFVFSPLGVIKITDMLYLGSAGSQKSNLESKFGLKVKGLPAAIGQEVFQLNKIEKMNITFYNALWLQKGYPINKKWAKNITKAYGFQMRIKDFQKDGAASVPKVNLKVAEASRKYVKDVVEKDEIDNNTRFMALSGVNYRYSLLEPFVHLEKGSFNGKEVDFVGLMNDKLYTENENYTAVAIDYEKNKQSIIFIKPKDGKSLRDVWALMSHDEMMKIQDDFRTRTVKLSIPKFSILQNHDMKKNFEQLGFGEMFTDKAQFTGLIDKKVKLDEFKHWVKYEFTGEVKGHGKKLGKEEIKPRTKIFTLDKSFIFLIRDNKTNTIVLMGAIQDI